MEYPNVLTTIMALFLVAQITRGQPFKKIGAHKYGAFRNSVRRHFKLGSVPDISSRPSHTRHAELWSKMGYRLAVLQDGTVRGVNKTHCRRTGTCIFELQSFGTSLIKLKNVKSGRYIGISPLGKVFTTKKRDTKGTLMHVKMLSTNFTIFWSQEFRRAGKKLFIALKRDGGVKNAYKSKEYHKSTHFVIRWTSATITPA